MALVVGKLSIKGGGKAKTKILKNDTNRATRVALKSDIAARVEKTQAATAKYWIANAVNNTAKSTKTEGLQTAVNRHRKRRLRICLLISPIIKKPMSHTYNTNAYRLPLLLPR